MEVPVSDKDCCSGREQQRATNESWAISHSIQTGTVVAHFKRIEIIIKIYF